MKNETLTHELVTIGSGTAILFFLALTVAAVFSLILLNRHRAVEAKSAFLSNMSQKITRRTQTEAFLQYAKVMALHHHEHWDGSGYPCSLKGKEIPVYVQALFLVEGYDA